MTRLSSSIRAFYINAGVREIIPIYPLYAIMFGEHGVSPFGLSVLFVIWALVGIALEIPSGALADRFSRKWLVVASGVLKSCAFLTWFAWQDFSGYALGFILWGAGSTLRSGAWDALLHDLLKSSNRDSEFSTHYGRCNGLAMLGVVFGEIAGGLLIFLGYDVVLLVSAAVPLIASAQFAAIVKDPPGAEPVPDHQYLEMLRDGVAEALGNRTILYLLLTCSFLIVTCGVYDEYTAPTLFEKGFPLALVAYLCVPIYLAEAAGHTFAHYLDGLSVPQLLGLMALSSLALVSVTFLTGIYIPLALTAFFFAFGLARTLFQSHLQKEIEGHARATVTSTVSLGDSLGAILWFFVFGAMAEATSMADAALGLGVIIVALCALFYFLASRWRVTR